LVESIKFLKQRKLNLPTMKVNYLSGAIGAHEEVPKAKT
jgi:hypothetical protein